MQLQNEAQKSGDDFLKCLLPQLLPPPCLLAYSSARISGERDTSSGIKERDEFPLQALSHISAHPAAGPMSSCHGEPSVVHLSAHMSHYSSYSVGHYLIKHVHNESSHNINSLSRSHLLFYGQSSVTFKLLKFDESTVFEKTL